MTEFRHHDAESRAMEESMERAYLSQLEAEQAVERTERWQREAQEAVERAPYEAEERARRENFGEDPQRRAEEAVRHAGLRRRYEVPIEGRR